MQAYEYNLQADAAIGVLAPYDAEELSNESDDTAVAPVAPPTSAPSWLDLETEEDLAGLEPAPQGFVNVQPMQGYYEYNLQTDAAIGVLAPYDLVGAPETTAREPMYVNSEPDFARAEEMPSSAPSRNARRNRARRANQRVRRQRAYFDNAPDDDDCILVPASN